MRRVLVFMGALFMAVMLGGCRCAEEEASPRQRKTKDVLDRVLELAPSEKRRAEPLIGGSLGRVGKRLYVADEDRSALRVLELPLRSDSAFETVMLPGPPAQVAAWDDWVLVSIRDPSSLIGFRHSAAGLREEFRVKMPNDAWGLAVTPDRSAVWVTSPWVARVSLVDLSTRTIRFHYRVKREPRGIALTRDGRRAYVTHLTSNHVTILDATADEQDPVRETILSVPAAPLRAPANGNLPASLAYAPVLSPDNRRLFIPRHALGALGKNAWFGAMTVDVLSTKSNELLAPSRAPNVFGAKSTLAKTLTSGGDTEFLGQSLTPVAQPRAALYRRKTDTLLVLGEGDDRVAEFDARALDPTMAVKQVLELGRERHAHFSVARVCGAPTGMALSEDEDKLYVFCRATDDLVEVDLESKKREERTLVPLLAHVSFRTQPEDDETFFGRALFFNATDRVMSGGLACAGCHPEGRDDGHTWHEATFLTADGTRTNFVGHERNIPATAHTKGLPRRTPMLAGRLKANGPFGWHGESKRLPDREIAGFALHRWGGMIENPDVTTRSRALFLAIYLRTGLVPPAPLRGELLTDLQARGEEIFLSKKAECSTCHVPATNYTNQEPFPLPPLPTRPGFDEESNQAFKTPSLRGLFGRAPYFHDGSAPSLFNLIETNHDRMGYTSHLGREDRDALIAFLETL